MNNSLRNEINAIFTSPEDSELRIHLKERNVLTKEVVVTYYGCSCSSLTESFSVGEIAGENASFMFLNSY